MQYYILGDFDARTKNNQTIIISNIYNLNPMWLKEDLDLICTYQRSSLDLIENLFYKALVNYYLLPWSS